jgi:hypothetical protein
VVLPTPFSPMMATLSPASMLVEKRLDDRHLRLVAEAEVLDLAGQAVQLFLLVVLEADPGYWRDEGLMSSGLIFRSA